MITAIGIRTPDSEARGIELGTLVRYHHRACVMRKMPPAYDGDGSHWTATGIGAGIGIFADPHDTFVDERSAGRGAFTVNDARINKTVAVWAEEGAGIVIGLVRRGIGQSVSPTKPGWGLDSYDYGDPGYFNAFAWVWLYAVKYMLAGIDRNVVLVPMDAVTPIERGST